MHHHLLEVHFHLSTIPKKYRKISRVLFSEFFYKFSHIWYHINNKKIEFGILFYQKKEKISCWHLTIHFGAISCNGLHFLKRHVWGYRIWNTSESMRSTHRPHKISPLVSWSKKKWLPSKNIPCLGREKNPSREKAKFLMKYEKLWEIWETMRNLTKNENSHILWDFFSHKNSHASKIPYFSYTRFRLIHDSSKTREAAG